MQHGTNSLRPGEALPGLAYKGLVDIPLLQPYLQLHPLTRYAATLPRYSGGGRAAAKTVAARKVARGWQARQQCGAFKFPSQIRYKDNQFLARPVKTDKWCVLVAVRKQGQLPYRVRFYDHHRGIGVKSTSGNTHTRTLDSTTRVEGPPVCRPVLLDNGVNTHKTFCLTVRACMGHFRSVS